MVAIFTGSGGGLERGSAAILGAAGLYGNASSGRNGESVFLNAATGNLVISQRDEFLVGRGPDASISRTYNSLAGFADDNGDRWRQSTDRRIYLTGTVNSAGSQVTRVAGDGTETVYQWNGSFYATTQGGGAHDKVAYVNGALVWTDGDSRITETYSNAGTPSASEYRIVEQADVDGNKLTFAYTGANLTQITTADGGTVRYIWSGGNISEIVTGYIDYAVTYAARTLTRTRYSYDGLNRLTNVTVDLSPEDSNVADGRTYVTTYGYDSVTGLISSVSQSDGSKVEFGYQNGRVSWVRQWLDTVNSRTTNISYDTVNRITTIVDAAGAQTRLSYDAAGQLVQVQAPPPSPGAGQPVTKFEYNAAGDVVRIARFADANQLAANNPASESRYSYDSNGNAFEMFDSFGTLTTRTYSATNKILSETRSLNSGLTATTRYVYDAEDHLRFMVSAEGRVTEYRYNADGSLYRSYEYPEHGFSSAGGGGLVASTSFETPDLGNGYVYNPTVSGMTFTGAAGITSNSTAWGFTAAPDGDQVAFVQTGGGGGGSIAQTLSGLVAGTQYTVKFMIAARPYGGTGVTVSFNGSAIGNVFPASTAFQECSLTFTATGPTGTLTFSGNPTQADLSTAIDMVRVSAPALPTLTEADLNAWVASITDLSGIRTTWHIYDGRGSVTSTIRYALARPDGWAYGQEGYTNTSWIYDQAGQLVSQIKDGQNKETYVRDGLGRVIASTDVHGGTTSILFQDAVGKTVVTLANGMVETSTYNRAGELINCIESGHFAAQTGGATYGYDVRGLLRVTTDATGSRSYFVHDALGRKVADVNHLGDVVEYVYDALGRTVATARYANRLTAAQLTTLGNPQNAVDLASIRPTGTAADLWTWQVYDKNGRVVEAIEGDGSVTAYEYDLADRLVKTIAYANKLGTAQLDGFKAAPPAAPVLPAADAAKDSVARKFYDKDGMLVGELDGEGFLTVMVYDKAGQKVEERSFLTPSWEVYRASGTFDQLYLSQGVSSGDRRTRWVYDGRGLVRFRIDGLNNVVRFNYDFASQLISTIAYPASIPETTDFTFDNVIALVANGGQPSNPATRQSWVVYDGAGRVAYTIDAAGGVVRHLYDTLGQLTKTIAYAAARPTTYQMSVPEMDGWAAGQAANPSNRTFRYYYTAAGELRFTVDSEGYVSGNEYDSEGRLTRTLRWATAITALDSDTTATIGNRLTGAFIDNQIVHDGSGRVLETIDGEGFRTRFDYNANGTIASKTFAYGHADASRTAFGYDRSGRAIEERIADGTAEQAIIRYAFDGLGNLTAVTDPNGNVTTRAYDRAGRMVSETNAENGVASFQYNAFDELVKATDARGYSTYNYYDKIGRLTAVRDAEDFVTEMNYNGFGELTGRTRRANRTTSGASVVFAPTVAASAQDSVAGFYYDKAGRLILTRDGENYVTERAYNGFGELASVTRRANRTTSPADPATPPTVTASSQDAVTAFGYDRLGRLVRMTDAEGYFEQYGLDAFGRRTGLRSKLGATTSYAYDKRGLLISETLPIASVASDGTPLSANVVNKYEYDGRGNRTKSIEAFGLVEARTTVFVFDKANRLTETRGDLVKALSQSDHITETDVTPTQRIKYDVAGNIIETLDAIGARVLTYYDRLNRQIAQLDGEGLLTTYSYDPAGNLATTRSYATAVAVPANPGGTPPAAPAGEYRETVYSYDKLNRRLTSTVTGIRTGAYVGSAYVTAMGSATATRQYDFLGNVIKTTDANGGAVYTYYDRLGRAVAQVDQENYLTSWTRDAEGNVLSERRAAQKAAGTPSTAAPPTIAAAGDDRVTNFSYDRNGRRLTETRTNVFAFSVDAATGALIHHQSGIATVSYTYNGLGQVTSKTHATGDIVAYTYDNGGRLISELHQNYANQDNAQVQPAVDYAYNGLNLLTRTRQGGTAADPGDRITRNEYVRGRLVSTTDANGASYTYAYDAAGNLLRERYSRQKSDLTTFADEAILYTRDVYGRTTSRTAATWNGSAWAKGDSQEIEYNLFGEVSRRGTNGLGQEQFAYDKAGRLWRTNSGDGVWRFFIYDANGNQTALIESEGTDLAGKTLDDIVTLATSGGAHAIGAGYVDGINVTVNLYDKRNQGTFTGHARRQLSETGALVDLIVSRGYNAFGEVSWERDPRGGLTQFTYNTMGRNLAIIRPTVAVRGENGSLTQIEPIESFFYDVSGRMVGTRDANGNGTTRTLLAGTGYDGSEALTAAEFHPDGGVIRNGYDQFGDLRTSVNEVGRITRMTYDARGRLTQLTQPSGLDEYFTYDLLGQRIRHWNSLLGSANVETSDYDLQGRLVRQVTFGGDVTTNAYSWSSSLVTNGMGTFGGWVQTTTYANLRTMTEHSDVFGRQLYKSDLGGHTSTATYDLAGRLVQRSGVETVSYGYFNTNLVASVTTLRGDVNDEYERARSTYSYDANGNKLTERFEKDGARWVYYGGGYIGPPVEFEETGDQQPQSPGNMTYYPPIWDPPPQDGEWVLESYGDIYQNATASYDSHNRMVSWSEAGNSTTPAASISQEYDANGNVRRTTANFSTLNAQGGATPGGTKDHWYRYDAMNRVVTSKGELSNGQIVRGSEGVDIRYDASSQRISSSRTTWESATVWDPNVVEYDEWGYPHYGGWTQTSYQAETREDYGYDPGGYLASVRIAKSGYNDNGDGTVTATAPPATGALKASYTHDTMGRLTHQTDWLGDGTDAGFDRNVIYNEKGQIRWDTTVTKQRRNDGGSDWMTATTGNEFVARGADPTTSYALGAVVYTATENRKNGAVTHWTETKSQFVWFDGAMVSSTTHSPNVWQSTIFSSSYSYNGLGQLTSVYIGDGRPRTVTFTNDVAGQVIRRDEQDYGAGGDPHEIWYRFDGRQLGYVGNNGTLDIDYGASIAARTRTPGSGAFRLGDGNPTGHADFDQNYAPINSYSQGSAGGTYTVRAGDSLTSIAAVLWGDSSLWYKIAEANGLAGEAGLVEGQTLTLPTGVLKSQHNASTFKPYDPGSVLGELNPTTPRPQAVTQPKKNKCGIFGQILLVVIAVAVSIVTYGALTAQGAILAGSAIKGVAAGAIAGVAGSVASQAVGVVTGIQERFDWKGVAMAGLSGAVGGVMAGLKIFDKIGKFSQFGADAARGAAASAVTQGIGVATRLQGRFSWAAVAAGGVSSAVSGLAGRRLGAESLANNNRVGNHVRNALAAGAGAIAGAATESLISGTDFGDNVRAALPGLIGGTIGNIIGHGISFSDPDDQDQGVALHYEQVAATELPPGVLQEPQKGDIVTDEGINVGQIVKGGTEVWEFDQPWADKKFREAWDAKAKTLPNPTREDIIRALYFDIYNKPMTFPIPNPRTSNPFTRDASRGGGGDAPTPPPRTPAGSPANGVPAPQAPPGTVNVPAPQPGTPGLGKGALGQTVEFLGNFWEGLWKGDFSDNPTWGATFGRIVSGFAPPADVRDTAAAIYNIYQGDHSWGAYGNLVAGLVGFVPVAGDAVKSVVLKPLLRWGRGAAKHGDEIIGVVRHLDAPDAGKMYNVMSKGIRGEEALTAVQKADVADYLKNFDLQDVDVRWVDDTGLNTAYGTMFGQDILNIGSDVMPGNKGIGTLTANSRISARGGLAHEIVGHREAALAGRTQSVLALEEAQASIRAARFGPGLSSTERYTLLRDGITRLRTAEGGPLRIRDVRDQLFIDRR